MFNQRSRNNNATYLKKFDVKKKMKVKIINDFIASKETMNAKTFKKNENNVQSTLYHRAVNKFFENNHKD